MISILLLVATNLVIVPDIKMPGEPRRLIIVGRPIEIKDEKK